MQCDVLVLGSTLGGLVAGTYLARSNLQVVLIEEDVQSKRPLTLREPFLMSGLEPEGWIRRVLREVALPLREQQAINASETSVQVVLRDARVEVTATPEAMAQELAAYEICERAAALPWLSAHAERAEEVRQALWSDGTSKRVRSSALPGAPTTRAGHFCAALFAASRPLGAPPTATEGALLLTAGVQAAFRMPDAGTPFLDLFRRRLMSLHGEVHATQKLAIAIERDGFRVEVERGAFHARALLLAVPRALLPRALEDPAHLPKELRAGAPPRQFPARLYRVEAGSLPSGMGDRTIVASGAPEALHWFSRSPDPNDPSVEWLQVHGPGAASLEDSNPLGELSPFGQRGVLAADPGPTPLWDLDGNQLRFGPGPRTWPRARLPLAFVGPEAAAGLGFEGEVLLARARAQGLARQLKQRRTAVAIHRAI